jgi:hypothetical protein
MLILLESFLEPCWSLMYAERHQLGKSHDGLQGIDVSLSVLRDVPSDHS